MKRNEKVGEKYERSSSSVVNAEGFSWDCCGLIKENRGRRLGSGLGVLRQSVTGTRRCYGRKVLNPMGSKKRDWL